MEENIEANFGNKFSMIEMHVGGVYVDETSGEPIVVLNDREKETALPLWIGMAEARAISLAVNKVGSIRPLTHDLYLATITKMGYGVQEVQINDLMAGSFKALLVLTPKNGDAGSKNLEMDARPSDAIALAAVAGAKLMVSSEILSRLGVPHAELIQQPRAEQRQTRALREAEDLEFKKFLENLKASDFRLDGVSHELNGNAPVEDQSIESIEDGDDFSPGDPAPDSDFNSRN